MPAVVPVCADQMPLPITLSNFLVFELRYQVFWETVVSPVHVASPWVALLEFRTFYVLSLDQRRSSKPLNDR